MIIAIDGPAAAGKGTLARSLAARLDFAYLDTGSLYRAVAARVLAEGRDPEAEDQAGVVAEDLKEEDLTARDLRSEAVGAAASKVAAQPRVRAALLAFQRNFARHPPGGEKGAILDGRDIGSVVCPHAELKFFVTASLEARAQRRYKELIERGVEVIYARVREDMQARDERDSSRAAAPTMAAEDAVVIDTSEMEAEAVLRMAMDLVKAFWTSATSAGPTS